MRNTSKILAVIAGVVAVAIIAAVMRLGKSSSIVTPANDEKMAQTQTPVEGNSNHRIREIVQPRPIPSPTLNRNVAGGSNDGVMSPKGTTPGLIADWDEKVNDILGGDGDEKDKAKKLIDMFPHLPADGQEEVAHHISNLVADEDYAPLSNFVTNSALPEPVLDVFVEDVFNRPNSIKLPLLLDIAQDPQHPRSAEAKDVLELFLEEDFGGDWTKWHAKMDEWLKANPD